MSSGRWKHVAYWTARTIGDDDVSRYEVNDEIDAVEWVPWSTAMLRLTYPYDRTTLAEAQPLRRRTRALVVLRHGKARSRGAWRKDDRLRPLLRLGEVQAERLVPLLAAYDVTSVHTSPSLRCQQTVRPYADTTGWPTTMYDVLAEEHATAEGVVEIVDALLHGREGAVLCTHRPVLPTVIDALGLPDVELEPGAMLVVHHRKGRVVATEVRQH
jgi:8-oxo-dGTP diphosphatase